MANHLEIIRQPEGGKIPVKAVLLDFDGTVSTLRQGWESIMEQLMIEMIIRPGTADKDLTDKIRMYIDESTGIQTIHQMVWLVEQLEQNHRNPEARDAWWYKDEYNRRLLEMVHSRINSLITGEQKPENFRIKGSIEFLEALKDKEIDVYIASGTDDVDVKRELEVLGISQFVTQVSGAPYRRTGCPKEAMIKNLCKDQGIKGRELVIIGDGKVEIRLGAEAGAMCIGAATDELNRCGINEIKRTKLIKAGAHAIIGDFINCNELFNWLGLKNRLTNNSG